MKHKKNVVEQSEKLNLGDRVFPYFARGTKSFENWTAKTCSDFISVTRSTENERHSTFSQTTTSRVLNDFVTALRTLYYAHYLFVN